MTPEIEKIQNEIGINLMNVVPVPWNKICFRAICNSNYSDIFYFFEESETRVISSNNNEKLRFKNEWYKTNLRETKSNLMDLPIQLYKEYEKINSSDKMWSALTYILYSNGSFNIDFEYESDEHSVLNRRQWCLKYFGETSLYYYKGLYPDTTDFVKL